MNFESLMKKYNTLYRVCKMVQRDLKTDMQVSICTEAELDDAIIDVEIDIKEG